MKKSLIPLALAAGFALASWTTTAVADSAEANCEVRERGDLKRGQSGPCMFSQRQGYIDIRLTNGMTYSLSPQEGKAGVYKDQEGRRVKRTEAGGNMHKYQWEHRNITVTFGGGSSGSGQSGSHGHSSGSAGAAEYLPFDSESGGEISDSLAPGDSKRYKVYGRNGQNLYLRVAARGPDMYYQVFNPDRSFMVEQTSANQEMRNQLWQDGDHVIEVINRGRSTVSYNVIFGIQ